MTIECPVFVEDDFHGPGGLTSDGTMLFVVDDDRVIIVDGARPMRPTRGSAARSWQDYHRAFHGWLAEAYPDVHDVIGAGPFESWMLPGFASGDPEHMKIALEYVAEFVEQSDVYPLEDGRV